MKKRLVFLAVLLLLFLALVGCGTSIEERYGDIPVGSNFGNNIDGYQKRLPYRFCLDVTLNSNTRLFRVPEELVNVPYFSHSVYNTPAVLEGRFVKGYYDTEKLVLCEQTAINSFDYVAFFFVTGKTERLEPNIAAIDDKQPWFSLCNTMEEDL